MLLRPPDAVLVVLAQRMRLNARPPNLPPDPSQYSCAAPVRYGHAHSDATYSQQLNNTCRTAQVAVLRVP